MPINPDISQFVSALSATWQVYFMIAAVAVHYVIKALQFVASHGGINGLKRSIMDGKDAPKNP